jgi:hypothetical protein
MAENINLNKQVFNKRAYLKTIDTSFNELGAKTLQEEISSQPTVQEFFNMYNTLFYNINELGPTNSHEYLIKTSQEYIGFKEDNEIIKLLQAEIAGLRKELLETQKQLSGLAIEASSVSNDIPEITLSEPETPEPTPIEVPTPSTPPTPDPPTDEERVINDFNRYPKSSIKKRSERLGLDKKYIRGIKKANNL